MSKDEKQTEKPTVKMESPPEWAIALSTKVVEGFNEVRADLETVKAEGQRTNLRLTRQEVRMDDVETRLANNSMRAQQSTGVDLDHAAKLGLALADLAEEKAKREALGKTSATKDDVKKMLADASKEQTAAIFVGVQALMQTPTAQKLKGAIVPVLMVAIAIIGLKLTLILNRLQEAPGPQQTNVVQLAPVTVYADAGASDK